MKTLILTAIRCSLMFLLPTGAYATSAQWDLDPLSGDWNTAANWTPMGIPNGPADTATFGLSNTTGVSISANTEVNGITFTPAATNPYTITAGAGLTLTISGVGITNNSGQTQNFVTLDDASGNIGTIVFSHHATAGSNVSISNQGGSTNFYDGSTAGDAFIENAFSNNSSIGGSTNFFDHSNAGTASINHDFGGATNFFNRSSAGNADIETFGGDGSVTFFDNSTAGNAFIGVTDNSFLQFLGNATAGHATIRATGFVGFSGLSTAGNAAITTAGLLSFEGSSNGGTARIELMSIPDLGFIGFLDISGHSAPGITIGSLAGDEETFVNLGANNLTIGSNNLSTTFAGVIEDGVGGSGGSLTKIGSGTLILSGANTYTGDTNVNRGVLQVDGSISSNTSVHDHSVLAGTGTINGNVVNTDFATVRPGGASGAPGMLTVVGSYTQAQYATLMIQIGGMSPGQFSVLDAMGNANLNGFLDPVLLNGFVPTIGETFTFLNYASLTGEFSHVKNRVFDNGMLQWSVTYEANNAILTVGQHTPDQGSTLLLLTLSLLGLVIYRQKLLRG